MLDKKKSVPIKLNYKGDLDRANNVTEGVTIKNGKEDVPLQTSYTTPIDIAAYPTLESLDGKENEEPTKLAPPSYPRRNCPTRKNPDFLWV